MRIQDWPQDFVVLVFFVCAFVILFLAPPIVRWLRRHGHAIATWTAEILATAWFLTVIWLAARGMDQVPRGWRQFLAGLPAIIWATVIMTVAGLPIFLVRVVYVWLRRLLGRPLKDWEL